MGQLIRLSLFLIILTYNYVGADEAQKYSQNLTVPSISSDEVTSKNSNGIRLLCPAIHHSTHIIKNCISKDKIEVNCQDAEEGTQLSYSCAPFYEPPSGDQLQLTCSNGSWSPPVPVCQPKKCPDLLLSEVLHATCRDEEGEQISCIEATHGSTLSYKCPPGYAIPDGVKSSIRCANGSWETPTPECQLEDLISIEESPENKVVCYYDSTKYYTSTKPHEFNTSLCTHVIYHYAGLSLEGNIISLDSSLLDGNRSLFEAVIDMKKTNSKLKILLSVSGFGIDDTDEFPTVAADPSKRSRFVNSAINFTDVYKFDGIDIFWHYPSVYEKKNYGILIKQLAESLRPRGNLFTATVYYSPSFLGYDISTMKSSLDWINVRCYDLYSEFSRYTGQSSPLFASSLEGSYEQDTQNVKACAINWNSYGISKEKVIVGISFLGRYYTLRDPSNHGIHAPITGSTNSNHTGLVSYSEICEKYANWTRFWDDEQKNPYKYYGDKWLGYDDPTSIKLKATYLKQSGYSGVAIFSIDADDVSGNCGENQILLKQVNAVFRQ